MDIGTKIRHRREQLGLSQIELAQAMHIAQGRISQWESGARTQMSLQNLRSLARALGVSADYLIGTWEDDTASAPTAAVAATGTGTARARGRGRPRQRPQPAALP